MQTQFDWNKRVVAVSNLEAMCERVSGFCHRFEVVKVTRSRVHVEYSNPDEYGVESPMTAIFPCYPSGNDTVSHEASPCVVLDILRVIGDNWHGEGWQAFQQLLDCPTLFRGQDEPSDKYYWSTHKEINHKRNITESKPCNVCVNCDLPTQQPA